MDFTGFWEYISSPALWQYVLITFPYQYIILLFVVFTVLVISAIFTRIKHTTFVSILYFGTIFKPIPFQVPYLKINFDRISAIFSSDKPKKSVKDALKSELDEKMNEGKESGKKNDEDTKTKKDSSSKSDSKGAGKTDRSSGKKTDSKSKNEKEEKTKKVEEKKMEEKPVKKTIFNLKKEDWSVEAPPKGVEPFLLIPTATMYFTGMTYSFGEIILIYLYIIVGALYAVNGAVIALNNALYLKTISLIFGIIMKILDNLLYYHMLLILLPVTRNSVWKFFFGTSYERQMSCHRAIGFITIGLIIAHGVCAFLWGILDDSVGQGFFKGYFFIISIWNIPGIIAAISLILMFIFTLKPLTAVAYDLFLVLHVLAGIIGLVAACVHAPWIILHLIPGVILLIIDLFLRFTNILQYRFTIVGAEQVLGEDWIILTMKQKTFIEPTPEMARGEQKMEEAKIDDDDEILLETKSKATKKGKKAKKTIQMAKMYRKALEKLHILSIQAWAIWVCQHSKNLFA